MGRTSDIMIIQDIDQTNGRDSGRAMDKILGWGKDQTLRDQGGILGRDLDKDMEGTILKDQAMGGIRGQGEDHMKGIMLRDHTEEWDWNRRGEVTVDKEEETGHKEEGNFRGKIHTIGATQDKWGVL